MAGNSTTCARHAFASDCYTRAVAVYQRKYRDKNTGELVACEVYNYDFVFAGQRYRGSTECKKKTTAKQFESDMKARLERALTGLPTEQPVSRVRTVSMALRDYEEHYAVDHAPKSAVLVKYCAMHLRQHLGNEIAAGLTETKMQAYRKQRLKEGAGPRTIDLEFSTLSRAFGSTWHVMWPKLTKLDQGSEVGQAVDPSDEALILERARQSSSPYLFTYLAIAFSTGMRAGEIRVLRWNRFILGPTHETSYVRVAESKTEAGKDRIMPMDHRLWSVMTEYRDWYERKLGSLRSEFFVFPYAATKKPVDPLRPVGAVKSAWQNLKKELNITYRLHDARHTVATALAVADVSEAKRRYLMGHVDEKVINRYTHLRADDCRSDVERAMAKRRNLGVLPAVKGNSEAVPTVSPTAKPKKRKARSRRASASN